MYEPVLRIDYYDDDRFVVRGETKPIRKELSELKGRWNPNLKGGEGWLFKERQRDAVIKFLKSITDKNELETPSEMSTYIRVWKKEPLFRRNSKRKRNCKRSRPSYDEIMRQTEHLSQEYKKLKTKVEERERSSCLLPLLLFVATGAATAVCIYYF